MGVPQTGQCERCGGGLPLFQRTGLCGACQEKRRVLARASEPRRLREHPDLAEIEHVLERWYL